MEREVVAREGAKTYKVTCVCFRPFPPHDHSLHSLPSLFFLPSPFLYPLSAASPSPAVESGGGTVSSPAGPNRARSTSGFWYILS